MSGYLRLTGGMAVLAALSSTLALTACVTDDDSSRSSLASRVTRDSAGIDIVEWSTLPRSDLPEWRFDTAEVVAVGRADGPSAYLIGSVMGASKLLDGRIVIADGQTREFRIYDSTGLHLKSIGGRGDGPGEFRDIQAISAVDSTRVSVFDPTLSRVTAIDLDAGSRTWQVSTPEFCSSSDEVSARRETTCEVVGILPDGTLLVKGAARSQKMLKNGAITEVPGVRQDLILVRELRPNRIDSVLGPTSVRWVGKPEGANVPFWASEALYSPQGVVASGAALFVVAGSSSKFEFRFYSEHGQLKRIIRSQESAERVTREMIAMRRKDAGAQNASEQARDYLDRFKPGGSVPHFGEVLIDRAERIWIEDYHPPATLGGTVGGQWTVLSPEGHPLGRVRDLAREDILELGADYGLFRAENDSGAERVVLRRLVETTLSDESRWQSGDDLAVVIGQRDTGAKCSAEVTNRATSAPQSNSDARSAPCRVVAHKVFELKAPSGDSSFEPDWRSVVQHRSGDIITAARRNPNLLLVWTSQGELSRVVNLDSAFRAVPHRSSPPRLVMAPNNTLHVGWYNAWGVLDSDFNVMRVINNPSITPRRGSVHVTASGTYLSTAYVAGGQKVRWFHLASSDGKPVRSFGAVDTTRIRADDLHNVARRSAYDGGDRFFVLPSAGSAYQIEEWTLEGKLIKSIRRDVAWGHPSQDAGRFRPQNVPSYHSLHVDGEGLLWTALKVKDPEWRAVSDPVQERLLASELYDVRFEVINPVDDRVLVSGVLDAVASANDENVPPIVLFIPGTRLSYRPTQDDFGGRKIEFFRLSLVNKRASL